MVTKEVVDLDHLEKYVAGDTALRDEILTIFSEQAEMLRDQFDPEADDEAWRDVAHALKGAARGVGAWRLGDLCETTETHVGSIENKTAQRQASVQLVTAEVDAALEMIKRVRAL